MFKWLFKNKKSISKKETTIYKKEENVTDIKYKKSNNKLSNISEEEIARAIKSILCKEKNI